MHLDNKLIQEKYLFPTQNKKHGTIKLYFIISGIIIY